jgi:hypothetical protein
MPQTFSTAGCRGDFYLELILGDQFNLFTLRERMALELE